MKIGDVITVSKEYTSSDFYEAGHSGVIVKIEDNGDLFVDFNNRGNSFVEDDGFWYVSSTHIE